VLPRLSCGAALTAARWAALTAARWAALTAGNWTTYAAQRGEAGATKAQLAILSGYSAKSSSLANALGKLRTAGYVRRGSDPIRITGAGRIVLGEWEPLPTGPALVDHWLGRVGKASGAVLRAMLEAWPGELDKATLAEITGYSVTSSSLANALGQLRTLELVEGWRANDELARAHQQA
jgi:hypothetical protein